MGVAAQLYKQTVHLEWVNFTVYKLHLKKTIMGRKGGRNRGGESRKGKGTEKQVQI